MCVNVWWQAHFSPFVCIIAVPVATFFAGQAFGAIGICVVVLLLSFYHIILCIQLLPLKGDLEDLLPNLVPPALVQPSSLRGRVLSKCLNRLAAYLHWRTMWKSVAQVTAVQSPGECACDLASI